MVKIPGSTVGVVAVAAFLLHPIQGETMAGLPGFGGMGGMGGMPSFGGGGIPGLGGGGIPGMGGGGIPGLGGGGGGLGFPALGGGGANSPNQVASDSDSSVGSVSPNSKAVANGDQAPFQGSTNSLGFKDADKSTAQAKRRLRGNQQADLN